MACQDDDGKLRPKAVRELITNAILATTAATYATTIGFSQLPLSIAGQVYDGKWIKATGEPIATATAIATNISTTVATINIDTKATGYYLFPPPSGDSLPSGWC